MGVHESLHITVKSKTGCFVVVTKVLSRYRLLWREDRPRSDQNCSARKTRSTYASLYAVV